MRGRCSSSSACRVRERPATVGAGRGIGCAIAQALARVGVNLALSGRHQQVTCTLWGRLVDPDDVTVSLASNGRRRLSAPPWAPPDP